MLQHFTDVTSEMCTKQTENEPRGSDLQIPQWNYGTLKLDHQREYYSQG